MLEGMAFKWAAAGSTVSVGTRPSVGVIMPAHNASRFIDQALGSIANQSEPPALVVVVDDASTDDTADRAESWSDRLHLRVIRLPHNVGSGTARRHGVETIDTDLLAPLDADDVWLPDHLQHLTDVWLRDRGVASAKAQVWRPGHRRIDYHRALGLRVPRHNQLAALLAGNYVFFGSLFSREDYERVGGFGRHRGWEDWELWVRMAANRVPITVADFPTVLYRRHEGNLTQDNEAFDATLIKRIQMFRTENPEWLTASEWEHVLRHRRAVLHLHVATDRLRKRQPGGVPELMRALSYGGWRSVSQLSRQVGYRALARGRAPRFR